MLKYNNVSLRVEPKYHRILLFRCFIGTVGIALQFYAMSKMVLTDAVVIIFTSPVLTFLLVRTLQSPRYIAEAVTSHDSLTVSMCTPRREHWCWAKRWSGLTSSVASSHTRV